MVNFNSGNLGNFTVISQEIRDALRLSLNPLGAFTFDAGAGSNIFGGAGSSVTVHLLQVSTSPAVQVISGNGATIDYTTANTQSDTVWTPVNVPLAWYQPDGVTIPSLLQANSPAKDLLGEAARMKTYQVAKAIMTNINSLITTDVYTNTFSISGDGGTYYTWAVHQDLIAKAVATGFTPGDISVTLNPTQFHKLVASIPNLPGGNQDAIIKSGFLDYVGGSKVYQSAVLPAGMQGYCARPNAMAIAWRVLPVPQDYPGKATIVNAADDATGVDGITLQVRQFTLGDVPNARVAFDCVYGASVFDSASLIPILA